MKFFTCLWQGGFLVIEALPPHEAETTFSERGYQELDALLAEAAKNPKLQGVLLLVPRTSVLAMGIDLSSYSDVGSREELMNLSKDRQKTTERVRSFPAPIICTVDGPCQGAALGLLLASHYRLCSSAPDTSFEFLDIKVGTIPCDGSTLRLPALIGLSRTLKMLVSGKHVDYKTAQEWGMIDSVFDGARLREEALQSCWALTKNSKDRPSDKATAPLKHMLEHSSVALALLKTKAIEHINETTGTAFRAPYQVLDYLLRDTQLDAKSGRQAERELFAELCSSPEYRALVNARKLGLRTAGVFKRGTESQTRGCRASTDTAIAILGGGDFSKSIASDLATRGFRTLFLAGEPTDADESTQVLNSLVKRKLDAGMMNYHDAEASYSRLVVVKDPVHLKGTQCFIDGTSQTMKEVQRRFREACSLSDNSTNFAFVVANPAINLQQLANKIGANNLLGLYCSHPFTRRTYAEISVPNDSDVRWITLVHDLTKLLGKKLLVGRGSQGSVLGRLSTALFLEALHILNGGASIDAIDSALTLFGMHKGPFAAMDDIGLDFILTLFRTMEASHPIAFSIPEQFEDIVSSGKLGRKSGSGFYRFEGGKRDTVDVTVYDHFEEPPPGASLRDKDIVERCLLALINEGARCLDDAIVDRTSDIDFVSVFGLGFPTFLGGLFYHAEKLTWEHVAKRLSFLEKHVDARFAPASFITKIVRNGRTK